MAARPRKELDPKSKDFGVRFAIHLRGLLDKRKLTAVAFLEQVQLTGLDVSMSTVKKWLNGERMPRVEDLPEIAIPFGLSDYRKILPDLD